MSDILILRREEFKNLHRQAREMDALVRWLAATNGRLTLRTGWYSRRLLVYRSGEIGPE
jgi:hypothetical protein